MTEGMKDDIIKHRVWDEIQENLGSGRVAAFHRDAIQTSVMELVRENLRCLPQPTDDEIREEINERERKELLEFLNSEDIPDSVREVYEANSGFNDFNKDNNAEPQSPHDRRRSQLDAKAFSALYDRDLLDKSLVSQHMASQRQDLKSALLDLMGKEWVSRAWYSMTSKTDINAWIKAKEILAWNESILLGKVEDLPSYTDLAGALLFNTTNLQSVIADGIYEDMCVNAIVCYHFAALVATVARQDKPIIDKLKDNYDTECKFYGFMTNFGCNSIFCLCHAAIVILRAIMLVENGLPLDSNCMSGAESVAADFDNSWGKTPKSFYDVAIGNSNIETYVLELSRVLYRICRIHDFRLGQEDADAFKIPYSTLMGDTYPSYRRYDVCSETQLNQTIASLEEGYDALALIMEQCENECETSDSLVSGFQVESGGLTEESFKTVPSSQITKVSVLNEQSIAKAVTMNDMDEALKYLAANVVIETVFYPLYKSTGNGNSLMERAIFDISYKNKQYTSIVEAGSSETVSQYIQSHRDEIVREILKKV